MDKITELKFIINRFDHYFDSVNGKCNLYLTLNTFLMGGVVAGYAALLTIGVCTLAWPEFIFIVAIALCIIMTYYFTMRALHPFISQRGGRSYIFYRDIAARKLPEWQTLFETAQMSDYEADLVQQSHELATGLQLKYNRLQIATWWIFADFMAFIAAALYLIIKHKL